MKCDIKHIEITKELKVAIELNQTELKDAICKHQDLIRRLNEDGENVNLEQQLVQAEEKIILIGLDQKSLLERLREEYVSHQRIVKTGVIKNAIEDRRFNFASAVSRARKQNIIPRAASVASFSDDSMEGHFSHLSPEHVNPIIPHDVSQTKFLSFFCLATHEVYKEMQNKRAERKRRSTANPQFLYGSRGWDFLGNKRTKRSTYLGSNISPPNTRQALKKKAERVSPPLISDCVVNVSDVVEIGEASFAPFPAIPNLPSSLTIERVSPGRLSPESKSYLTGPQTEKLEEKKLLEEKHQDLSAELTQLQDRHSQLTISLKDQRTQQERILKTQQSTQDKIKQILNFISSMQSPLPEDLEQSD